jgi:hypothetical protein
MRKEKKGRRREGQKRKEKKRKEKKGHHILLQVTQLNIHGSAKDVL